MFIVPELNQNLCKLHRSGMAKRGATHAAPMELAEIRGDHGCYKHGAPLELGGLGILLICLGAMLACFLVGEIGSLPAQGGGQVSVAFLGLTNDDFGAKGALFEFTNGFTRDIGFAAGPIEIRGREGWPHGSNHTVYVLTHLGPAYKVSSGGAQVFTVPVSNVMGVTWRAPIVYAKVGSRLDSWVDMVKGVLGRPGGGVAWRTNTPEMVGLSNQIMQPTPR